MKPRVADEAISSGALDFSYQIHCNILTYCRSDKPARTKRAWPGIGAALQRRTMGRSAKATIVFPGLQADGGIGKKAQPRRTEKILLGMKHHSEVYSGCTSRVVFSSFVRTSDVREGPVQWQFRSSARIAHARTTRRIPWPGFRSNAGGAGRRFRHRCPPDSRRAPSLRKAPRFFRTLKGNPCRCSRPQPHAS